MTFSIELRTSSAHRSNASQNVAQGARRLAILALGAFPGTTDVGGFEMHRFIWMHGCETEKVKALITEALGVGFEAATDGFVYQDGDDVIEVCEYSDGACMAVIFLLDGQAHDSAAASMLMDELASVGSALAAEQRCAYEEAHRRALRNFWVRELSAEEREALALYRMTAR